MTCSAWSTVHRPGITVLNTSGVSPMAHTWSLASLETPSDYQKYQGRSFTLLMVDEAGHYAGRLFLTGYVPTCAARRICPFARSWQRTPATLATIGSLNGMCSRTPHGCLSTKRSQNGNGCMRRARFSITHSSTWKSIAASLRRAVRLTRNCSEHGLKEIGPLPGGVLQFCHRREEKRCSTMAGKAARPWP